MSTKARSLFDREIVVPAMCDSLRKLNPVHMWKNPVMFVTEVGAAVTTLDLFFTRPSEVPFVLQISVWLWFTVIFANFAEAMAEGRGKAQAETLRKSRTKTRAKRRNAGRHVHLAGGRSPPQGRRLRRRGRRDDRRRRRDHRRRRHDRRIGHHRRVGPRHPRSRAATARPSPAAPRSSPTRSRSASPPTRASRSWTA